MNKQDLRKKYKQLRAALTAEEIDNLSIEIANKTLQVPIWHRQNFHIFLPIKHHNEVNTEFLLHLLAGKNKDIIISRSNFETREMSHFQLTDETKIVVNPYGIPEPVNGIEVGTNEIEVIFVPLLAFDRSGNRVGYGKGFYDKFMASCNPSTIKVGLSFFEAEDHCADLIDSDVRMDFCVTPRTVYQF